MNFSTFSHGFSSRLKGLPELIKWRVSSAGNLPIFWRNLWFTAFFRWSGTWMYPAWPGLELSAEYMDGIEDWIGATRNGYYSRTGSRVGTDIKVKDWELDTKPY